MSSFKEKERLKEQQEQFQAVLSALLKDEDNKYCVDCDAKGPRWASWNIGIFLCIRCAGIHRNLGVHISKVKSVNLDTWTPEQVVMMQEIGNSRGRAVYEANIPDGFRRPQTDSSLEAFIRSKYEQKKYIAREWIPPQPKVPRERVAEPWLDDPRGDKKKVKAKPVATSLQLTNVTKVTNKPGETTPTGDATTKSAQAPKTEVKVATKPNPISNSASNDLLGLEAAAPPPSYGGNELLDLFGGPQATQTPSNTVPTQSSNSDLMNGASEGNLFGEDKSTGGAGSVKTSAKDSIMALYGGGGGGVTNQPQMYGVPASHSDLTAINSPAYVSGSYEPKKAHDNTFISSQAFDQRASVFSTGVGQSLTGVQPMLGHSTAVFSSPTTQPPFNFPTSSISAFDIASSQTVSVPSSMQVRQYLPVSHSSIHGFSQQSPVSTTMNAPQVSGQFLSTAANAPPSYGQHLFTTAQASPSSSQFFSPANQMPGFSNKASHVMAHQDFGQSMGSNTAWGSYNLAQSTLYSNQGGVYMPQGQQMYPGMMAPQQAMMGIPGIRQQGMMGQPQGMVGQPQGMVGQPQGMVGQPQGMTMMRQPHGMMGNPAMNTPQMAMYNNQMVQGNPGMYTPQQMQQLQYQQMQQQMTSLKMGGSQMGSLPQQTNGAGGWGNPGQGQTLSTNLWQ